MKKTIAKITMCLGLAVFAGATWSQVWPSKPIKVMIGFPPGTIVDGSIRQVANEMEKKLGQQIVFEFKPGASGTIAAKAVVTAPADGYTLLYGPAVGVHPLFTKNNAVDSGKEFVSVSNVISNPFYFIASGKLPVKTFDELRKYAAANPVPLSQGNSIETQDLIMEILRERTGLATRSIPYKGSTQIVLGILSGEVDLSIGSILAYVPHIPTGGARVLFVAAAKRNPIFPAIPTAAEVGIQNFELSLDYGLWAPLGTPNEIVRRLATEAAAGTRVTAVVDQLRKFGTEPIGSTPEEQLRTFNTQIRFWTDAIKQTGYKPRS